MIPLRDDNPSRTVPFVTRAIIAVNVAVFLYEASLGPAVRSFVFDWGLVPQRLTGVLLGMEPPGAPLVTLGTSMFLHGGWVHLLGNMWYLWIFGDNVEDRFGHGRFLAFYLAAGVVSALLHTFVNPGSVFPTVGASGAIAGVLGAYAVLYPRARVLTLVPLIIVFQVVSLPALLVLGLWFVVQFFSGALALGAGSGGGVAWWAHIGGFAFGMLLASFARRERPSRARVAD